MKVEHISSSLALDATYQKIELLLIGFASVFVTFLWIGIFSTVFTPERVRVTSIISSDMHNLMRSAGSQAHSLRTDLLASARVSYDVVAYQFVALWESSCISQDRCDIAILSQSISFDPTRLARDIVDQAQESSLIAIASSVLSLRLGDASGYALAAVAPGTAYAKEVLGESTTSPEVFAQNVQQAYFSYVDMMTFGSISALAPSLVGK